MAFGQLKLRNHPRYDRWVLGAVVVLLLVYCIHLRNRRSPRCEVAIPPCPNVVSSGQSSDPVVTGNVYNKALFDEPITEEFVFRKVATREHMDKLKQREQWASKDWSDLLLDLAEDNDMQGYTIIALANSGMKEMTMNWIASLLRNGFTKFVIICFDFELYMFLAEYGFERNIAVVPQGWLHKSISADFQGWLSEGYKDLLHGKLMIMMELWKHGRGVFYNDVDLVFLSPQAFDYIMYETKYQNPDFIYMVDGIDPEGVVYLSEFQVCLS